MEIAANLKQDIEFALEHRKLNAWQRQFLQDIHGRVSRGGNCVKLSDKQWKKVFEILGERSNVVHFPAPQSQPNVFRPIPSRTWRYTRRTQKLRRRDAKLIAMVLVIAAIGVVQLFTGHYEATNTSPAARHGTDYAVDFSVTDGDTIHVAGETKGTRLVGYNAPEVFSPRCSAEKTLGDRATARLSELVKTQSVRVTKIACACAPGTEGTDRCNYGRSCAILYADGKNVAEILIGEGLAVPFTCQGSGCPPTPRPWCG